jgi:hypothetical protein
MARRSPRPLRASWVVWLAFVVLLPASAAHADGVASYFDPVLEHWRLLDEPAQHAVVDLRDGRETLLLKVHVRQDAAPQEARQLVWVTPIPAAASAVAVDILRGFPGFQGHEPRARLAEFALGSLALMSTTQFYPLFAAVPFVFLAHRGPVAEPAAGPAVTVHETVERHGVQLQLLTAESTPALDLHLRKMGVEFPREGLRSLETYVGRSSCLVVFRIVDLVAYRKAISESRFALGIEVRFPSDEGFFPLTASSALPTELLEVAVVVPQFVTAAGPVPSGMSIRHMVGEAIAGPEAREALGAALSPDGQRFTVFSLLASPKQLTHDLRFRPGAPRLTRVAASLVSRPLLLRACGVLSFLGLSVLAAQCAYGAWPRHARPSRTAVAAIGLANTLTVIGALVATILVARQLHVPARRAVWFATLHSLVLCLLIGVLMALIVGFAA